MQNVGEDIVLLAIKRNGTVAAYEKLRFAVTGAELVRLVGSQRISIDHDGFIEVVDPSPTGDALTDRALAAIDDAIPPLRARTWVARQRPMIVDGYFEHLAVAGTIRADDRKLLGRSRLRRWIVIDAARVFDAKGRLDAIAWATGPATSEQAAFAGLAHAVGLDARLYRGRKGQPARSRLAAIARQDGTIAIVNDAATLQNAGVNASSAAAANAAVQSATWLAIQSSVIATHHAAISHQHHQTGHVSGHDHGGGGMAGGHHG